MPQDRDSRDLGALLNRDLQKPFTSILEVGVHFDAPFAEQYAKNYNNQPHLELTFLDTPDKRAHPLEMASALAATPEAVQRVFLHYAQFPALSAADLGTVLSGLAPHVHYLELHGLNKRTEAEWIVIIDKLPETLDNFRVDDKANQRIITDIRNNYLGVINRAVTTESVASLIMAAAHPLWKQAPKTDELEPNAPILGRHPLINPSQ